MNEFDSLAALLFWVAQSGGAMMLAGYVFAYFVENIPAWHELPRWVKTLTPIAVAAVLGFGAQSALSLDVLTGIDPKVASVILMLINWLMSQKAYKSIKEGDYGKSAR